ncbi:MAG: DUF1588 domain-containing protein [Pseudomonadota bacterium]|nr:DUF1588 domain-containing protein [Pseudomonadota bacterium]
MILLLACAVTTLPPPAEDTSATVPLSAPLLLRRMSLDLRGTVPSADELDQVEADPAALATLRDAFLEDARLEGRLVTLFAERFHTRLDAFEVQYYDYGLDPEQEYAFESAVGEEPLRLMAHVAVTDAPWSDIVTVDYTIANDLLAEVWPLDYPADTSGWAPATYTDGRPAAGILATNGLWWRYVTNTSNQNRSRAAAIARLLLCEDLLSRPVSFSGGTALADAAGTAAAIQEEPACVACHASIEPLAASLFGFWVATSYNPLELGTYHAEREAMGESVLGVTPGYFGQQIEGLVDLGGAVASDTRFWQCSAQTAAELLWRRESTLADFDRIETLRQGFVATGGLYKPLLRAVTDTPEYRAGSLTDAATEEDLGHQTTLRMLTAEQLASAVEDLTGFRWLYQGYDQLANDTLGYRVLAGGVDGYAVGRPQSEPGITWALVVKRLSQAAASHAAHAELEEGAERRLFSVVTPDDRPGSDAFTAELEALHWRLYARRVSADGDGADRLAADEELWTQVDATDGPAAAWAALASAMLRDPEFVGY